MNEPENPPGIGLRRYVRVELLTTVVLVFGLLISYAYLFLDDHLEWGVESLAGRALGAEVNLADLETGWFEPRLTLRGMRVTDPSRPARNWFEFEELSVQLSTPALLRAKLVVDHARLRTLRFHTERASPGWVDPEGGDLRWVYDFSRRLFASSLASGASGTFLEDALAVLGGATPGEQLKSLKDQFETPRRLEELADELDRRGPSLRNRVESLPGREELERLRSELDDLENRDEDPLSWARKLKRLRRMSEELSELRNRLEEVRSDITGALGSYPDRLEDARSSLESDLEVLRRRFSLPTLTLENPSRKLFESFLEQRAGSLNGLLARVRPHLNRVSSGRPTAAEPTGTRPGGGRDYRFLTQTSDPDYWIKEITIGGEGRGADPLRVSARASNLTSHPDLVAGPLHLEFDVRFPGSTLGRFTGRVARPRGPGRGDLDYAAEWRKFHLKDWSLIDGDNLALVLSEGVGNLILHGRVVDSALSTDVSLRVGSPTFRVDAASGRVRSVIDRLVSRLGELTVQATGEGVPPGIRWSVDSNLGEALSTGFRSLLRDELSSAEGKLRREYRSQIRDRIGNLRGRVNSLRRELDGRLETRASILEDLEQRIKNILRKNGGSGKEPGDALKDLFSSR